MHVNVQSHMHVVYVHFIAQFGFSHGKFGFVVFFSFISNVGGMSTVFLFSHIVSADVKCVCVVCVRVCVVCVCVVCSVCVYVWCVVCVCV